MFSPWEGHFSVFLSVSLCFSWVPPPFPPLCFAFSCSVSLFFFVFVFFLLSFGSWLLSLYCFSLLFAFVHGKEPQQKIQLECFIITPFLFGGSCLLCFQTPFPYLSFFLIWRFVLVFFSINVFLKQLQCLVKRGVATQGGFEITCVLQNFTSYRCFLWPFFGQILVDVHKQKKHRKHLSSPPPKKGFFLISQCLPLCLVVLLGFPFRIVLRIPSLKFLALIWYSLLPMFPSSSSSFYFFLFLVPLFFLFSSLCLS